MADLVRCGRSQENNRDRPATPDRVECALPRSDPWNRAPRSLCRYPSRSWVFPGASRLVPAQVGRPVRAPRYSYVSCSGNSGSRAALGFRYQVAGPQQRIERAGVRPPAFQMGVGHGAFAYVGIVDVSDLELSSAGRHQLAHLVEYRFVVHIDAGDREIRFGRFGFFFYSNDATVADLGDAEALGVLHFFQQDLGAGFLPLKIFRHVPDTALDDIVAQDDADAAAIGEMLGQAQGVRDAAFAFLIGVVQMLQAEFLAVGQQAQEISRVASARHHQDLLYARIHQRLDGVVNHGLVVDGKQMLIGDLGEREHAAARAAR